MSSTLQAGANEAAALQTMDRVEDEAGNNFADNMEKTSLGSSRQIEAVVSAENDTITLATESSISPATVLALGGEEAATKFVERFAASFAEKYSAEFQKHLAEMKAAVMKDNNATNEVDNVALEKVSTLEAKPPVLPGELAELAFDDKAKEITESPLRVGDIEREMEVEPVMSEGPPETAERSKHRNSHKARRRRRSVSSTSRTTRSSSQSSSSSGSVSRRSFDVTSEYEAKEASIEDMKVQIWKIDDIFDEASYERMFVTHDPVRRPTAKDEELSSEKYSKWILVLRRVFENDNKTLRKTKLDIQSPLILDILQDIVKEEQAVLVSRSSVTWPNDDVFRYRQQIKDAAVEKGELAIKHIEPLLELIHTDYSTRIRDIENMFSKGTSSFEILREAFWPGDIVVKGLSEDPRAYRVTDASYIIEPSFGRGPDEITLLVTTEFIDFSGREFGTVSETFRIKEYNGVQYLKDLKAFPLKYHSNKDVIKKTLLDRGRKFEALKGKNHKVYNGPVDKDEVYQQSGRYRSPTRAEEPEEISSEIIVDAATYNRFNTYDTITVSTLHDELIEGELTEELLMICTNRIPFFSLQDKKFHKGNIANVEEKIFNEKVFSQLVLPESTKDLVRVLVRNHKKGREFDDFVKGKGKGLVILLHGPPGVGKTMTAEAVAEYTHRPLYVVTCGELGTTPEALEASLERVLDISNSFGAVLLLDEADIFLEQRTPSDLQRNALVSIFLRLLEYYKGILFLTTNRIRTFDDAFHSRIHITLGYSNHDAASREKIWRNFGTHMISGLNIEDGEYKELAMWELNGRQIKNVLGSCKALAADRGDQITMDDLRTVLQISNVSGSKLLSQGA